MKHVACLIIAGLICVGGNANALEIACPDTLPVTPTLKTVPAGWTSHNDTINSRIRAEHIAVYDGAVEGLGMLMPDNADSGDAFDLWTLSPSRRGNWVECRYTHTSITLSQRLPDKVKSCRVERPKDDTGMARPPSIRCK